MRLPCAADVDDHYSIGHYQHSRKQRDTLGVDRSCAGVSPLGIRLGCTLSGDDSGSS